MTFLARVAFALGLRDSSPASTGQLAGTLPPSRGATLTTVTAEQALTLSTVFRAVQVVSTSVSQLSVKVQRNGAEITTPSLIKTPSLKMSRRKFLEQTTTMLALSGECFWLLARPAGPTGPVVDIDILNTNEVHIQVNPDLSLTYWHRGTKYMPWQIKHLRYLDVPGRARGLGPIQAAQTELRGTLDARDYASLWFTDTDEPTGILSSDQDLDAAKAKRYKDAFNRTGDFAPEAGKRRDIRVLGSGLTYNPMILKPADVQFLESQQFSTTQIARLFGIPSSIMLAAVQGNSQTYSNVEQDWIGYSRFTLMKYVGEIEDALSDLLPYGQTAVINVDALLRSDTKTRYEAHGMALSSKWKTVDEVRATEGMAPLTDAQRKQLSTQPAPAAATALPAPTKA